VYYTEFLKGPFYDRLQHERNLNFFDGSARLLELAGFNPDLLDLERATAAELAGRPALWLFTLEFMSRPVMEKLAAYVQAGGRVVFNPLVPTLNERMQPDAYLTEQLGIQVESVRPMSARNYYRAQDQLYMVESDMALFRVQGAEVLLRDQEGRACVVRRRVGKGEVLAIGFGLYHQYDYLLELVRDLARGFGLHPRIQSDNWEVHAALRTEGKTGWLFLANFHDAPRSVSVQTEVPGAKQRLRFPRQGQICLPNRSAYFFPLNLPVAPGVEIVAAECEMLQVVPNPKSRTVTLAIRGLCGHETRVTLGGSARVRRAWIDGKSIPCKPGRRETRLMFSATGAEQTLKIKI
jgi:hypothetical protein